MQATEQAGFCFAHLSDPHLTSLHGVHWRELTSKRVLGYLSWRRRRRAEHRSEVLDTLLDDLRLSGAGHVVITGDLTHIGLPDEFRQARLWLNSLGDSERVTVVPGNHDAYARASWSSTFSLWEPYMQSDARYRDAAAQGDDLFPSLRVRDGVALIGLSSARASAPFLATGRLGRRQLERLSALLGETARQGLFRVVMLHHPPREQDEKWRKRLTDGKALCGVLEQYGAELVLHGHSHRSLHSSIRFGERDIPVFGIPSASALGRHGGHSAQYYLYRIRAADGHWSVQISVRGYQPDGSGFRLQHQHHLELPLIPSTSA